MWRTEKVNVHFVCILLVIVRGRYSLKEPRGNTTPAGDFSTLLQGTYQIT